MEATWAYLMTKASAASLEIDPTRGLLYGSSIGCALVVSLAVQLKNAGASAIQPRFLILDRSLSFFFLPVECPDLTSNADML